MLDSKRTLLTALVLGTSLVVTGCSQAPLNDGKITDLGQVTVSEQSEIRSPDVKIAFDKSNILTVAAPPEAPVRKSSEAPVAARPVAIAPETATKVTTPALVRAAPVQTAVPVATVPVPVVQVVAPPASPETRYVHVGLSGGQNVVDLERGPVLFPLPAGFPPYVAEHDMGGGWARFGTLKNGMKVSMSGLVGGTYTVGQIITVPKFGSTDDLRAFTQMPKVMLQTCIPGTNSMMVVGLY